MRYCEIITTETVGDAWEQRHAAHQRQQQKRTKLTQKITTAKATAERQRRAAEDRRAATNDRLRQLQQDMTETD